MENIQWINPSTDTIRIVQQVDNVSSVTPISHSISISSPNIVEERLISTKNRVECVIDSSMMDDVLMEDIYQSQIRDLKRKVTQDVDKLTKAGVKVFAVPPQPTTSHR